MDGKPLSAVHVRQGLVESFAQQDAVRQAGKRIVARHVRDLHFRLSPLGDVFVGRHPATARHGLIVDRDGPAVIQLDEPRGRLPSFDHGPHIVCIMFGITGDGPVGNPPLQQMPQSMARPDAVGLETVHGEEALVADDEPGLTVEHHQALGHVGDGRRKAHVLRLQLGLALAQLLGTLDHRALEVALNGVDLLDHEGHGPVGASPVAVDIRVGVGDESEQLLQIDRSGFIGCFGDLPGEKLVHDLTSSGWTALRQPRRRR